MIQKHRISTNIGKDQLVNVELKQDYDLLEILSLRFTQQQAYSALCSDYGVVCGRISVNNGLGIPNARVSIFIPQLEKHSNDPVISALYPYKEISDKDDNNYRYNLLPSRQQHPGHAPTGTFPDQEDILTREEYLEVYESYYTYTVKTNNAGDFMIWGVPLGKQTIHVDVDLSDIGCFSLRPYDFIRQGDGVDKFKNTYMFKSSEDLSILPQIVSFDKNIEVFPFWGNEDLCQIGLTRSDFDLSDKGVKIQPTATIIGGIYGDQGMSAVNKNCKPRKKMGRKCDLAAKSGKIEAIRFTPQKDLISGTTIMAPILETVELNEDIPDDGSFVFPIEMNMDYVYTNEFGENVITNDPNKGVPTSACYRFRINMNDNDLSRARANADFLIPNIREYTTPSTEIDKSYYFGTEWSGYPTNSVSTNSNYGILYSELGEYYPRDYFYRFNYNKVYTVSSFHSNYQVGGNFANINEIHPAEEEDCGDKLTPPTNFGFKNYTFTLLIADFLLSLDFVIKFLSLHILNISVWIFNTITEVLITVTDSGRGLRDAVTRFQINNQTKLSLINYPECVECSDETDTVGGVNTGGFVINNESGCSLYDTLYDESLVTGYFVVDSTNTKHEVVCNKGPYGRKYVQYLSPGDVLVSTAIWGKLTNAPESAYPPSGGGDFGAFTNEFRDVSCDYDTTLNWSYNGGPITPSARSEFANGVFYIIPGTMGTARLTGILREYYRRKRVGKMFCGGIVNYAFLDNWLSGSLYFTQFKVKRLITAISRGSERTAKYCRDIARLVIGQKRLYYRSAPTSDGITFTPDNINKPTTFVDLGPRDEFIKEICTDPNLDPNCSISRSIGATSYQDLGELLGLAINYRMDISNADGNLNMFFQNDGFNSGVGISNTLDGDILQLLSINNETGIQQFDLQDPRYLGYQFNILDPEVYTQVFKNGNANYGPLPVTLELSDDGQRIRSCLNEVGRLTESSQKVPFYLWNKRGTGFGSYSSNQNNQSWDYSTVQTQPLQGMTYGYNLTGGTSDPSDKYLLLPMTYTFSGQTIGSVNELTGATTEFDVVSTTDGHASYNTQYPGFTYLYANSATNPTSGTLYTRYGNSGTDGIVGWSVTTGWTNTTFVIKRTQDYYNGTKQILSTPFQFYFGLINGKTGLDKFVDYFGPKNAFVELTGGSSVDEPDWTPTPTPTTTNTPTPTPTPTQGAINPLVIYSGTSINAACSGTTSITIYYTGTSIQIGEKLYSNNTLTTKVYGSDGAPGYYYAPAYNTIYVVNGSTAGVVSTTAYCPSPTPVPVVLNNLYIDSTAELACGASPHYDGISLTGYGGTNISNVQGFTNTSVINDSYLGSVMYVRQSYHPNPGDSLITKVRKFTFNGTSATSDGVAFDCGTPAVTPTPSPAVTSYVVTVYAHSQITPDPNSYDTYFVYSRTSWGNNTGSVRGIPKITYKQVDPSWSPLMITNSVDAGETFKMGAWLNYNDNGSYNHYMQVKAYVYAGTSAYNRDRFGIVELPTDQIDTLGGLGVGEGGCDGVISNILDGVQFIVGQSVDVYLYMGGNTCSFGGTAPVDGNETQIYNQ